MATQLNEDTSFKVSIKTLAGIAALIFTLVGMWFTLQADISEAKELPKPEVSKMEFDMKDINIRNTIIETRDDVKKLEERMIRMEDKIDELKYCLKYLKIIIIGTKSLLLALLLLLLWCLLCWLMLFLVTLVKTSLSMNLFTTHLFGLC